MNKVRITVQVMIGATGEGREVVAHVAAVDEQDAVNKLFAKARTDDYYYRFLGQDTVIEPTGFPNAHSFEHEKQTYWAMDWK